MIAIVQENIIIACKWWYHFIVKGSIINRCVHAGAIVKGNIEST